MTDTFNILDFSGVLSSENLFHAVDEKAAGTNGGSFTSGSFLTRDLNTIRTNTITGASLSSNQITLPIGTYFIEATAPAFRVDEHKTKIRDITNTADLLIGTSELSDSAAQDASTISLVSGLIVLAGITVIELQHRGTMTQNTTGFGKDSNFAVVEIYSDIKIWKVA